MKNITILDNQSEMTKAKAYILKGFVSLAYEHNYILKGSYLNYIRELESENPNYRIYNSIINELKKYENQLMEIIADSPSYDKENNFYYRSVKADRVEDITIEDYQKMAVQRGCNVLKVEENGGDVYDIIKYGANLLQYEDYLLYRDAIINTPYLEDFKELKRLISGMSERVACDLLSDIFEEDEESKIYHLTITERAKDALIDIVKGDVLWDYLNDSRLYDYINTSYYEVEADAMSDVEYILLTPYKLYKTIINM